VPAPKAICRPRQNEAPVRPVLDDGFVFALLGRTRRHVEGNQRPWLFSRVRDGWVKPGRKRNPDRSLDFGFVAVLMRSVPARGLCLIISTNMINMVTANAPSSAE
jgi:hypothetical protein